MEYILIYLSSLLEAIKEEKWYSSETDNDQIGIFFEKHLNKLIPFYNGHVSLAQCLLGDKCPSWLRYNPSFPIPISPFTDDFWHFVKKLEKVITGILLAIITGNWWWLPLYYFFWMAMWTINYHVIIPIRQRGVWKPLWRVLRFWKR